DGDPGFDAGGGPGGELLGGAVDGPDGEVLGEAGLGGGGDELAGADVAEARVVPAHEGLGADDGAVGGGEDGLEDEAEFVAADGAAQFLGELVLAADLAVEFGVVGGVAVLAGLLGG
ncbi:hypothetical protein ADL26_17905, partial [Thermoactinomyces vulgaris]